MNWAKAVEVGLSLLISPLVGFACAAGLLLLLKKTVKAPELYQPPEGDKPPPPWIRGTLLLTCSGVSLAHGSNDGQKGIGLVMLILIGVLPAHYALDPRHEPGEVARILAAADEVEGLIRAHVPGRPARQAARRAGRPPEAAGRQGRPPRRPRRGALGAPGRPDPGRRRPGRSTSTRARPSPATSGAGWPTAGRGSARRSTTPRTGS